MRARLAIAPGGSLGDRRPRVLYACSGAGGLDVIEMGDEFRERECSVSPGTGVDDRVREVTELKPDDQVGILQALVPQAAGAVGGQVDSENAPELERLGERGCRPEVGDATRPDSNRIAVGRAPQQRFRKSASEPVPRADEDDVELGMVGEIGHRPKPRPNDPRVSSGCVRVSVIIPTFQRPQPLRDTLTSVLTTDPLPDEVLVIDAGPSDETRQAVAAVDAGDTTVQYLEGPIGMTRQRNFGLDRASGDVIVFLDDDVIVDEAAFARLTSAYDDPGVVGATGRVIEPSSGRRGAQGSVLRRLTTRGREGTFTRAGYPRYLSDPRRPADVEFMPGCFMSARLGAARATRFDEALAGYALAEDEDFAFRLSRLGRIRHLPEAVVLHKKLGFRSYDSREFGRIVVRNRAYLFRKNFPQTRRARAEFALLVTVLIAHRLLNREWSGARGLLDGAVELARTRRALPAAAAPPGGRAAS